MGSKDDRRGAGADRQGDAAPAKPVPIRFRPRSRRYARARPEDTDWTQIDLLWCAEDHAAVAGGDAQPRGRGIKVRGPEAALDMIEPLGERLSNYFHFFGVRGAFLMQLGLPQERPASRSTTPLLANTSAEAAHIRMHLDRLMRDSAPRGAKAK